MFTRDLAANLRVSDAMSQVAQRYRVTPSAVAVSWTLGFGGRHSRHRRGPLATPGR
jgi:aryl-alcohol dehydrogenase-like predicted oxidoreductase